MTISYNIGVPAGPDNPSIDQPQMLINTVATNNIIGIDHITFNANNGGQHQQVRIPSAPNYIATPSLTTGNASVIFANAGSASSAAQLFFTNSNAKVQLSALRAWGYCDSTGAILSSQSSNIASVTPAGTGRYNVTLTTNAVSSTEFAIFVSSFMTSNTNGTLNGYNITGIGTFQLVFLKLDASDFANPANFTFQVLQF